MIRHFLRIAKPFGVPGLMGKKALRRTGARESSLFGSTGRPAAFGAAKRIGF